MPEAACVLGEASGERTHPPPCDSTSLLPCLSCKAAQGVLDWHAQPRLTAATSSSSSRSSKPGQLTIARRSRVAASSAGTTPRRWRCVAPLAGWARGPALLSLGRPSFVFQPLRKRLYLWKAIRQQASTLQWPQPERPSCHVRPPDRHRKPNRAAAAAAEAAEGSAGTETRQPSHTSASPQHVVCSRQVQPRCLQLTSQAAVRLLQWEQPAEGHVPDAIVAACDTRRGSPTAHAAVGASAGAAGPAALPERSKGWQRHESQPIAPSPCRPFGAALAVAAPAVCTLGRVTSWARGWHAAVGAGSGEQANAAAAGPVARAAKAVQAASVHPQFLLSRVCSGAAGLVGMPPAMQVRGEAERTASGGIAEGRMH